MFRRTILASLLIAAGVSTYALVKQLMEDSKEAESPTPRPQPQPKTNPIEREIEEREVAAEVLEICALYPYLEEPFVEEIFAMNDELNAMYPEDTLITLSHKATFPDRQTLEEFGVILEKNGYAFTELGNNQCEVSKKMFTENGRIISDIYNVSNQVACLGGTYEGYTVA